MDTADTYIAVGAEIWHGPCRRLAADADIRGERDRWRKVLAAHWLTQVIRDPIGDGLDFGAACSCWDGVIPGGWRESADEALRAWIEHLTEVIVKGEADHD